MPQEGYDTWNFLFERVVKMIKKYKKTDCDSYIVYCIIANDNFNNYIEICYNEPLNECEAYNYDEYLYSHGKTFKLFSNSIPSHFVNMGPLRNSLHYALFLHIQEHIKI